MRESIDKGKQSDSSEWPTSIFLSIRLAKPWLSEKSHHECWLFHAGHHIDIHLARKCLYWNDGHGAVFNSILSMPRHAVYVSQKLEGRQPHFLPFFPGPSKFFRKRLCLATAAAADRCGPRSFNSFRGLVMRHNIHFRRSSLASSMTSYISIL